MSSPILNPGAAPLFDDSVATSAKNGSPTTASPVIDLATAIQFYQHQGRPIFHFWGGKAVNNKPAYYRFLRFDKLEGGGQAFRAMFAALPASAVTPTTDQGVRITEDSTDYDTAFAASSPSVYSDPEDTFALGATGPVRLGSSGVPLSYASGPIDTASPYLTSGCYYEDWQQLEADPTKTLLADGYVPGAGIIATKTSARTTLDILRDRFTHVWKYRRPSIGWSIRDAGTGASVNFSTSKNAYRYIFDQSIGDGGTAPSATGRATTLPLRYSAAGLRNQIRVYVWVYAALSAGTGTGTLAVASKDSSGTMTGMTALTNNVAITGTGFDWWPHTGAFDPATNAYFTGYAGGAFDRILLGAKTSGTATVKIAAFQMVVVHSTL